MKLATVRTGEVGWNRQLTDAGNDTGVITGDDTGEDTESGTGTRAAVVQGEELLLLPARDVGRLLAQAHWREVVEQALADAERLPLAGARLTPVIPRPGKIVCVGHNYRAHLAELGQSEPAAPTLFTKWADGLLAHREPLALPAVSTQVDWEAEMAVVVGAPLRGARREEAAAAIAGYTIANDVSVRDLQKRTSQWLPGKAFDALTPLGPWLVTADAFEPAGQRIRCLIDGEVVQEGDPGDLVFDAATLLAEVSTFTRLRPGDLLLTGTPGGVGMARTPQRWLQPGQELITEITGIGQLVNPVIG
ncbi:fumarylacetoacetate hydrolase family protein [Kineococcus arenarius]|uniref:fumarylacetoacetate hydrolase family protein n=1 Tax=Kineococcus sp. SYSU DK007 TaxID=3383128 RepID=UPI003D7E532F